MATKDTYYPQAYRCDNCQQVQKHYIWASEADSVVHFCTNCEHALNYTNMYEEPIAQTFLHVGAKMKPNEIQKERKVRSRTHFKQEILPTLGQDERKHFAKKYNEKPIQ